MPRVEAQRSTAWVPSADCDYANGHHMHRRSDYDNGIAIRKVEFCCLCDFEQRWDVWEEGAQRLGEELKGLLEKR